MENIPENNKNSKPVQLPLINLDSPLASEAFVEPHPWYYITRRDGQDMLVGFDMDGGHLWVGHNIHFVTPHLFAVYSSAYRIASRNGWQVLTWPYSRF